MTWRAARPRRPCRGSRPRVQVARGCRGSRPRVQVARGCRGSRPCVQAARGCRGRGSRPHVQVARGWSHGGSDDFTIGKPISVTLEQKCNKIMGQRHKIVDPFLFYPSGPLLTEKKKKLLHFWIPRRYFQNWIVSAWLLEMPQGKSYIAYNCSKFIFFGATRNISGFIMHSWAHLSYSSASSANSASSATS